MLSLLSAALLLGCNGEPHPMPPGEDPGCVSCHNGIEQVHASIDATECTICHGGDGTSFYAPDAHIAVPEDWAAIRGTGLPPAPYGFIEDFAPDQLDKIDPAYLRFVNPGDIRAQAKVCGECHPEQSKAMPFSVMATNAGHYYPTLFLAGIQQDRLATVGSFGAVNPDCDPTIEGVVCEMTTIVPPDAAETTAALTSGNKAEIEALANRHYLSKNCNTCHQAGYPRNDSPGLYRSSGCTSCHMPYDKDGTYKGGDPTIPTGSPVHPRAHILTTKIPTETCASCHFQGGRIGLAYQGIREGGFSVKPEFAVPINETLNGRAPGFYISDEDSRNEFDETPPDLHYTAGMVCADCHVDQDVHGTGQILSSSKQQVGLRCEDCHGTIREPARPDADGNFITYKGRRLPQLEVDENGDIFLTGKLSGQKHIVPQVVEKLSGNPTMVQAMGENADGWSHTDSLTCDTCHTAWVQTCIGCHVSVDFRLSQVDYQTGLPTPGFTKGGRAMYSLTQLLLGTAPDGRVQTVQASQQVQMAVLGGEEFGVGDGEILMGGEVPDGNGGFKLWGEFRDGGIGLRANNGFAPFFQHTTTVNARTCDHCHRKTDTPEEAARIRGVYGHGTGEFMLTAPDGSQVDGLQFLDDARQPLTVFQHERTGPMAPAVYDNAWNVILDEL